MPDPLPVQHGAETAQHQRKFRQGEEGQPPQGSRHLVINPQSQLVEQGTVDGRQPPPIR
ncbi:hypothetical protein D3C76_1865320 [compost metagenome]